MVYWTVHCEQQGNGFHSFPSPMHASLTKSAAPINRSGKPSSRGESAVALPNCCGDRGEEEQARVGVVLANLGG